MRRLPAALGLLAATAAALPAGAAAAEISVDQPCYADPGTRMDTIKVTGSQFDPSQPFQATLAGSPLNGLTGTTGDDGSATLDVPAPALPAKSNQAGYLLGLTQGANAPQARISVSRLLADFTPRTGNPRTLKVQFRVYGFALGGATTPPVFLHYVAPNGKLRTTVRLGVTKGGCGRLTTGKRRLFGFKATRGTWRLQFDTSQAFVRGAADSPFLFYDLGVRVS